MALTQRRRRLALASVAALAGLFMFPSWSHATPGKSPQWITLSGTCDGVPTVVLDPPGPGPTAFSTLTGKMGVGRLFQVIYLPPARLSLRTSTGWPSSTRTSRSRPATSRFRRSSLPMEPVIGSSV